MRSCAIRIHGCSGTRRWAIFSSSRTDATPLTPEEQRELIPAYIAYRSELNEAEQENIARAQDWALARRRDPLSEKFVTDLHKQMLGDVWRWAGKFRTSERNLGIPFYEIPVALRELRDEIKAWIEYKSYPPDEIAVRFHHRLVQIHPFPNGNGRHARLMADLLVMRLGRRAVFVGQRQFAGFRRCARALYRGTEGRRQSRCRPAAGIREVVDLLSIRARISSMFRLVAVFSVLAMAGFPASPEPRTLQSRGAARQLHAPVFGASTTALYEHLLDNPAKIAALKTMSIGLDRFPGGSDANFYNWRTGLIEIQAHPDSSRYVQFWAKAAARIAQGLPHGVTLEQYDGFSREIGAQVILVPNFESSTVADQVEWFKRLAHAGIVPERIELGNEYWVAMLNDPASLARWPDEPTSMRIMKEYLDALRPYLPSHAKVAAQASSGAADIRGGRFGQRLKQWDEDLRPEPWFDAVTLHLYPRLRDAMGDPNAGTTPLTLKNALSRLTAMMARVDEGVDRILQDTERRLPGKELWITEWNARGSNIVVQRGANDPMSPGMEMLATTRMAMVQLRHPAVTASLFFSLGFDAAQHAMFVSDGRGSYVPVPTAAALRWLNEAANAGGSFQRVVQAGARLVAGGGARDESYFPVEGGLFQSGTRATLILENASSDTFSFDPAALMPNRRPSKVEFISMPDLSDTATLAARINTGSAGSAVAVAPFSVTRVVWE